MAPVATSRLPTAYGTFQFYVFPTNDGLDNVAAVFGDVTGQGSVLCRVHSECLTGEVFGSLKCDCKGQLDLALELIAERGSGILVYLRQEGRGIGLYNKIQAYALQEKGADTVDANRILGFPDDARDYSAAIEVFRHFDIQSIALMTNNPLKVEAIEKAGVRVTERLPLNARLKSKEAQSYLQVKHERMGHFRPERPCGQTSV